MLHNTCNLGYCIRKICHSRDIQNLNFLKWTWHLRPLISSTCVTSDIQKLETVAFSSNIPIQYLRNVLSNSSHYCQRIPSPASIFSECKMRDVEVCQSNLLKWKWLCNLRIILLRYFSFHTDQTVNLWSAICM